MKIFLGNFLFSLLFIPFFLVGCNQVQYSEKKTPEAEKGILDLTNWEFQKDGLVRLDGEWEFYWKQLLEPQDFHHEDPMRKKHFISVAGSWNGKNIEGNEISGEGYTTYKLDINLKNPTGKYGLKILTIETAYKLWINGELITSNGVIGKSRETMTPQYLPQVVLFTSTQPTLQVIIQVSNFNHRKGGIREVIELGTRKQILQARERQLTLDNFLFGSLFMMAFYHFGLYMLRGKDFSPLFYGLFCLVFTIRILFTGEMLFINWFPDFNWEYALTIEYLTVYFSVPLLAMFMASLYPDEFNKKVLQLAQGTALIFGLIALTTKATIHTHILNYYLLFTACSILYLGYVLICAFIHKREGASFFIIGFLFMALAVINDILYANEIIFTTLLAPMGLFMFTFSQALLLCHRFAQAFSTVERFSITFQKFVPQQFLNRVAKEGIHTISLGSVENDYVTILFSDIRAFTPLSEKMSPKDVFNFLNSYLSRMEPSIQKHDGFVDKYIGDAIMALFDSGSHEEEAENALNAAIGMQRALKQYNIHRANSGYSPIRTGIGIHSGQVMIGTLGSSKRMESTAIGDAVNLASRIEGMTKIYDASILISDETFYLLKNPLQYSVRYIDRVIAKGKTTPITLYEVFDEDPSEMKEKKMETKTIFEKGIAFYGKKEFGQTFQLMEEVLALNAQDTVAQIYLERCKKNLDTGVDESWNGITMLDFK